MMSRSAEREREGGRGRERGREREREGEGKKSPVDDGGWKDRHCASMPLTLFQECSLYRHVHTPGTRPTERKFPKSIFSSDVT